jgi:N utilization substance protein B
MSRTAARETVARLLYQWAMDGGTWQDALEYTLQEPKLETRDMTYVERMMQEIPLHCEKIDETIASISQRWRIDRMSKMDLSILRLAVYEMENCEDIPVSVSINEAVELAKRYGGDDTPNFINGMLSTLASRLAKQQEAES